MNNYIKISLIAIVAVGIAIALGYFTIGIGKTVDKPIAVTEFEKHVQYITDNEIKGKEYTEAHASYISILSELNTEASITRGDGEKNLSDAEYLKCTQIAFYEYVPIFSDYALAYFKKSSWDDSKLKELKRESESLLEAKIVEHGTTIHKNLQTIIKNVDDYYAAWKVANSASHCNSVARISQLTNSAKNYKREPLTNNASLLSALNSVEQNAKNAVVKSIVSYANNVATSYRSYNNYESFYASYEKACNRIEEYKKSYGTPSDLSNARKKLDKADDYALEFFSN